MDAIYQSIKTPVKIDYVSNSQGGKMASVHYHDAYEIYILEKGERSYIIDGTFIELSARDVALIKPYELHSTDGSVYSRYLLYLKDEYLDRFFTKEAKERLLAFFGRKKLSMDKESYDKVIELLIKYQNNREDFLLLCEIMQIFLSCSDEDAITAGDRNKLIYRIVEYLAQNFISVDNLDTLADYFFITKPYLCRLFKKETGISVVTFINTRKLQLACEKLQFTRTNVEQIATECGFNSSMYFCKFFKNAMGVSPGEYRKQMQY